MAGNQRGRLRRVAVKTTAQKVIRPLKKANTSSVPSALAAADPCNRHRPVHLISPVNDDDVVHSDSATIADLYTEAEPSIFVNLTTDQHAIY
ncbi:hypothetical protein PAXRUDRAFT_368995 [Paxillus rubicundulus Ve08.2h10]|uniref:Uncharacterized protein n=1 Tax=Paxillus rubicundulus Ve08.2h10 TaxID=930991 RepID=A0A0D0DHR9_9AGAM|nr:hypothetical protein PAXRUDRAFT_368995 [Paxillus rubicundulus Ve08.2h10]